MPGDLATRFACHGFMPEEQTIKAELGNDVAADIGRQLRIMVAADENPVTPALQRLKPNVIWAILANSLSK